MIKESIKNLFNRKKGNVPRSVPTPESKKISQEFRPFTHEERRSLMEDGATIVSLVGEETIEDQERAGKRIELPVGSGDSLLKTCSTITEVAIYLDPKRFFILNSDNKDLPTQEELAKKDGEELRERLGLRNSDLDVIIPQQASILTGLILQYIKETGIWLFGDSYLNLSGRTKNPVDESGSLVADVTVATYPNKCVRVDQHSINSGSFGIAVVRLVVAKKEIENCPPAGKLVL